MSWADRSAWMAFDGTEVINSTRLARYMSTIGCSRVDVSNICIPCDELIAEVSNPPFFTPELDRAPWYDGASPISKDFYGIGGIDILGVAGQPSEVVDGAVVRDMEFTVVLGGKNEAALSYGIGWLAAVLQGRYCQVGSCAQGEMCLAVSCPTADAPDPVRTFMDVVVVDKPTLEEVITLQNGVMWVVTFTVRSRHPWAFQDPGPEVLILPSQGELDTIDLVGVYDNCPQPTPCGEDPLCPRPVVPVIPEPPLDRCYPDEPFEGLRSWASITSLEIPTWIDVVPVITVNTGSNDLRNFTIRFWQNPLGLDCSDVVASDPCNACTDITVPFLPAGSQTVLDGRVNRALTTCLSEGGTDVDVPTLFGPAGQVFGWPTFSCSIGICMEVITATGIGIDTEVNVGFYTRWEAM